MTSSRQPLGEAALAAALEELVRWRLDGAALLRVVPLAAYREGPRLVAAIAQLAEELDHHPELTLSYGALSVRTCTHTPPGISELDLELARGVDLLLA